VRSIVTQLSLPIVLDAGGLTAFYGRLPHLQEAARTNPNIIITPHTGEYAKLTGTDATKERAELTAQAVQFAKDDRLTLVLKGSHTIVCHPDRLFYENQTGNPGLATAGTGDVLTGMISGLLAQNVELGLAVETAVYLHGLAGDLAAAAKTQPGVIASDVIDFLPEALKKSQ
jgi:NAD(P)H-hydrate epimerase